MASTPNDNQIKTLAHDITLYKHSLDNVIKTCIKQIDYTNTNTEHNILVHQHLITLYYIRHKTEIIETIFNLLQLYQYKEELEKIANRIKDIHQTNIYEKTLYMTKNPVMPAQAGNHPSK